MAPYKLLLVLLVMVPTPSDVRYRKPCQKSNTGLGFRLNVRIEDNVLLVVWYNRLKIVRHASNCPVTYTRFAYALLKSSKHGLTYLQLPGKILHTDLTIYMDVESNPGPMNCSGPSTSDITKPKCKSCERTIAYNHRSVTCQNCDLLYHFKCAGLTVKDYKQLQSNSNQSWMCSICTLRNFPRLVDFAFHFNFKRFNAVII